MKTSKLNPKQSLSVLYAGILAIPLFILMLTAPTLGQVGAVKIALSPRSTTPAAYLLENLPKVGCANVSFVADQSQADYVLEAQGGDFEGAGGSEGAHEPRPARPKAHYALSRNGAVVFETTPVKEKSAVKDLCKYLQHRSSN